MGKDKQISTQTNQLLAEVSHIELSKPSLDPVENAHNVPTYV